MKMLIKLLLGVIIVSMPIVASTAAQFLIGGITLQGSNPPPSGDPTVGLLPTPADGWANWQTAGLQAIPLSGYIAGATLTVTTSHSNALGPGQVISGPGVSTTITAMGSGTGDTGTYTVSPSQTVGSVGSPIAMTANGIPNRSTISTTLTPSGGDDTAQINAAMAACPAGKVVLLSLGVFKIDSGGGGLHMDVSGCTLRGSGPGAQKSTSLNPVAGGTAIRACAGGSTLVTIAGGNYCTDSSATQIVQTTRTGSDGLLTMWRNNTFYGTSYNLAADAVQGAFSVTLTATPSPAISQGDLIILDECSTNDPNTYVGNNFTGFTRANCRNITEQKEVASASGATVTFVTPIMYPYHISETGCSGCASQVTTWTQTPEHGGGIENLFIWGGINTDIGMGEGGGAPCAYCWIKNVEAMWSTGCAICIAWGYHDVIRDSFIHESAEPENGGAGYLTAISSGSTETLIENNIMWYGNKYDVMQTAGGGNVLAYNYGDDSFGLSYPDEPEAGWNDAHNYTTHLGLMEGNYGANFAGDSYWGSAIFISAFRNWLSGLRASSPPNAGYAPLNSYSIGGTGCGTIYYGDYRGDSRAPVQVEKASFYNNFVGNVLGYSGQTLLSEVGLPGYGCSETQTAFMIQVTTDADYSTMTGSNNVPMWDFGEYTAPGGINLFDSTTIQTITRLANWDWVSSAEHCYAFGSATTTTCTGAATALPNSFYLAAKPAFFGTHPWPWVSPTTGATSGGSGGAQVLLPAMYCFQQGKMPTCALP